MVTEHLCIAPSCRVRSEHAADCPDPKPCSGCRPDRPVLGTAFCQRCTDRLAGWLDEIPDLFDEVVNPPDATNAATAELGALDPVTVLLPAGAVPGPSHNPRVSGSPEEQIANRYVEAAGGTTRIQRDRAGRLYHSDQLGDPPPAVVLDSWCKDWAAHRRMDEHLPDPTVANLCRWLTDRLEDALRSHPAMAEFYTELHGMHSRLWSEAGRSEPTPVHCKAVPCKRCDRLTLYRSVDGSGDVECRTAECGRVYRAAEYDEWAKIIAAPVHRAWLLERAEREKENAAR